MVIKSLLQKGLPYAPESLIKKMRSPVSVTLEVTNICNLECRTCAMPKMKRTRGFMSLDNFKKIIDSFPPEIKLITMNWSAEPLINKDIFKDRAVIISETVKVRSGPGDDKPEVFELSEGVEVSVERCESGWCRISAKGGFVGWVSASGFQRI